MENKLRKIILPIALSFGITAMSAGAGAEGLGKFILKEKLKSKINPNKDEITVNVYNQPQQSKCTNNNPKWVYTTSDNRLLPIPGCRWANPDKRNDYQVYCPPGVDAK